MMSAKARRLSQTFNKCVQRIAVSMFGLVDDCILLDSISAEDLCGI